MAVILEYINEPGRKLERKFREDDGRRLSILIKCYIEVPGSKRLKEIEKPSTRPATINEAFKYVQKLKKEYGNQILRLIVWDLDLMKEKYPEHFGGYENGSQ